MKKIKLLGAFLIICICTSAQALKLTGSWQVVKMVSNKNLVFEIEKKDSLKQMLYDAFYVTAQDSLGNISEYDSIDARMQSNLIIEGIFSARYTFNKATKKMTLKVWDADTEGEKIFNGSYVLNPANGNLSMSVVKPNGTIKTQTKKVALSKNGLLVFTEADKTKIYLKKVADDTASALNISKKVQ